jgi:ankyrin repeat protein
MFLIKSIRNLFNRSNEEGNINQLNQYGASKLFDACSSEDVSQVRWLLSKNADTELAEASTGFTPLIVAVRKQNIEIVELLLKSNANVNAVDLHDWSSLHYACLTADSVIVELLLTNGADATMLIGSGELIVNRSSIGTTQKRTCLHAYIIQKISITPVGESCFHLACRAKQAEPKIIKLLHAHHGNHELKTTGGDTALHMVRTRQL